MPIQPDPVVLAVTTGTLTLLAGFGAWALGHFLYTQLASAEYKKLRGWTEYKAAFWGDLLILPMVNGLIIWVLTQLPFDPVGTYWLPIFASIAITTFVHLEQATLKHVNWTMPKPWRWNSFGSYHALFMVVNLTITLFFLEQAVTFWAEMTRGPLTLAFVGILVGWLLMLSFFFLDRSVTMKA